ncbi:MAG: hypothetical protein Q7S47_00855 [bacterium]|nr:hypothetical protein [bacterium]
MVKKVISVFAMLTFLLPSAPVFAEQQFQVTSVQVDKVDASGNTAEDVRSFGIATSGPVEKITVSIWETAHSTLLDTPYVTTIINGNDTLQSFYLSPGWFDKKLKPSTDYYYRVTAFKRGATADMNNTYGNSFATSDFSVTRPDITSFKINGGSTSFLIQGDLATISWTSNNASYCTASGDWSGRKEANGSESYYVTSFGYRNYGLQCFSDQGLASTSVAATPFVGANAEQRQDGNLAVTSATVANAANDDVTVIASFNQQPGVAAIVFFEMTNSPADIAQKVGAFYPSSAISGSTVKFHIDGQTALKVNTEYVYTITAQSGTVARDLVAHRGTLKTTAIKQFQVEKVELEKVDALAHAAEDVRTFRIYVSDPVEKITVSIWEASYSSVLDTPYLTTTVSGTDTMKTFYLSPGWFDKKLKPSTDYYYRVTAFKRGASADMYNTYGNSFTTSSFTAADDAKYISGNFTTKKALAYGELLKPIQVTVKNTGSSAWNVFNGDEGVTIGPWPKDNAGNRDFDADGTVYRKIPRTIAPGETTTIDLLETMGMGAPKKSGTYSLQWKMWRVTPQGVYVSFGDPMPSQPLVISVAEKPVEQQYISNVSMSDIKSNEATFRWTTELPSSDLLYIGESIGSMGAGGVPGSRTSHEVTWKNLKQNVTYYYRIEANDGANNVIKTEVKTFTTLSAANQQEKTGDAQIADINKKVGLFQNNQTDQILAELNELRNKVKEQESEIKFLKKVSGDLKQLTEKMQGAITTFVTYGVDDNTKNLGAGERAAVINSYKSAYNKLPDTDQELQDLFRIANGRFPSITNASAEKKAKAEFRSIYKRVANMNNPNDSAAVTVMAYGLRQSAENRNLKSESAGIAIFSKIYGHTPQTTEEWNIMQAITYSGASRKADSDKDGLSDEDEKSLGTDSANPDSDGDGYLDGEEVENGFNALRK